MRVFTEDIEGIDVPIIFIAGKCAKDNQTLVLESSSKDLWFHLADFPSAHLVAKIDSEMLNKDQLRLIIKRGSSLLKSVSNKQKSMPNLGIHYTYIENVRPTDVDGLVELESFKTITI
jgi:hypothetical protein